MGEEKASDRMNRRLLPDEQANLFEQLHEEELDAERNRPVECLGMTFENDEARRTYFLDILREKLKDPEFRKIEGFPIGSDEDILALSDPPYYTACPNPFIGDFIKVYGKPYDPNEPYSREPFAADVSEGKNDPIYNAHSYHTKVPHKAIMRYILHYTEPGDVVFDGFCGTGMTGVAAQLCGDTDELTALGLIRHNDGTLVGAENVPMGRLGLRRAILNDLSPAATLIAAGYNLTTNPAVFQHHASALLDEFNDMYGWMYQTTDPESGKTCDIDFTVWSEIFSCPVCSGEIEFWGLAYDADTGSIDHNLTCPQCSSEVTKRDLIRRTTAYYDQAVGATRAKQVLKPVEIHYRYGNERRTKTPDAQDMAVLDRIGTMLDEVRYPTELIMFKPEDEEWGDLYRGYHQGINRVHDFFLVRQLVAYSLLWQMGSRLPTQEMARLWRFTLQSIVVSFTRRNRFRRKAYSQVNTNLSGTLYIGSTVSEPSPTYTLTGKIKRFAGAIPAGQNVTAISTQSLASVLIPDNSVDYVFLDPPFGDNLPYAELNFLWEAWLGAYTNAQQDAIISSTQHKPLSVYTEMMTACLRQAHRVLKPGRWITVEFHNSQNAVWTAIQEALGRAGFIIADVSVLDKGMKTKKQLYAKAVDKDLVISAYKPNGGLEQRFGLEAGTEDGMWDFIQTHLRQLPVFVTRGGHGQVIVERQQVLLFDRMVAFHVQRNVTVPLSAGEFYRGLAARFPERDGMYFLPEQVEEYERKRMTFEQLSQLELFVSDEASAIQWLRQQLRDRPRTFQELQPQFMRETQGGWEKCERPLELMELLEQNFLCYDGTGEVPSQIHSYLSTNFKELRNRPKNDPLLRAEAKDRWYLPDPNKAGDLEKLRERALLREFAGYLPAGYQVTTSGGQQPQLPGIETSDIKVPRGRKLRVVRLEAVRAGFKQCWQNRDYRTIVVVARSLPENILQEDPKLLMWYDQAVTRSGEE